MIELSQYQWVMKKLATNLQDNNSPLFIFTTTYSFIFIIMHAYRLDLNSHIFDNEKALVAIRRFSLEAPAQMCATTLRSAGVQCFVTNTMSASMLPMIDNSIGLYVHHSEFEVALDVLKAAEKAQPDYRNADHDMINYAKKLNQWRSKIIPNWTLFAFALFCIALIIVRLCASYF